MQLPHPPNDPTAFGPRPTLLIGLGGTGQKVLRELKARFVRGYGAMPPNVEMICFDTDGGAGRDYADSGSVSLTPGIESMHLSVSPDALNEVLRHLQAHPAIAAWMVEEREQILSAVSSSRSPQVMRPVGRLALFLNIGDVYRRIRTAVSRLAKNLGSSSDPGIDIYIVTSVCGGTGSGMFLDMAYLVRKATRDARIPEALCCINGIFALPGAFPLVADQVAIQANAYASLQELDHVMETWQWNVDYGDPSVGVADFDGTRPFNTCYLINGRNERGLGSHGLDEIAPLVADAVFLQVASRIFGGRHSAMDDLGVLSYKVIFKEENTHKITAYSSLGTASLLFPVAEVIEICANRLTAELIARLLRYPPIAGKPNPAVAGKVEKFAAYFEMSETIGLETLFQLLARNSKGELIKVSLDPRALDINREAEMLSATLAYVAKAEAMIENEFTILLDLNRKTLFEKLKMAIGEQAVRLAEAPESSLNAALSLLDAIDTRLNLAKREAEKAIVELEYRRTTAKAATRPFEGAFAASFKSFPLIRPIRIRQSRDAYVSIVQADLGTRLEIKIQDAAMGLLGELTNGIALKRSELQNLANRLQSIQGRCQEVAERLDKSRSQSNPVFAESIVAKTDIDAWFETHVGRLGERPEAALLDQKGPLRDWAQLEQDEIAMRIMAFGRETFADLSDITIEQIIFDKRELVHPLKRIDDLVSRSTPLWSYEKAGRLPREHSTASIIVVGVAGKRDSIYQDALLPNMFMTSTSDPYAITVLRTEHGLPLFALTQYPSYKDNHDKVIREGNRPLYVLPELRPGGERTKLTFALGLVYGFVYRSGASYFRTPDNPADAPSKLGHGLSESLRSLRNDVETAVVITKMVDYEMARAGRDATAKMLEDYIRAPYVFELRAASKVNVDRERMNKDTTVAEPGSNNAALMIDLCETLKKYVRNTLKA